MTQDKTVYPDTSDIFALKDEGRREIRRRSFGEKIAMVEKLRERLAPLKKLREENMGWGELLSSKTWAIRNRQGRPRTSTAERKLRLRLAWRYEGSMSEAAFRQQNRSRIGGAVA